MRDGFLDGWLQAVHDGAGSEDDAGAGLEPPMAGLRLPMAPPDRAEVVRDSAESTTVDWQCIREHESRLGTSAFRARLEVLIFELETELAALAEAMTPEAVVRSAPRVGAVCGQLGLPLVTDLCGNAVSRVLDGDLRGAFAHAVAIGAIGAMGVAAVRARYPAFVGGGAAPTAH